MKRWLTNKNVIIIIFIVLAVFILGDIIYIATISRNKNKQNNELPYNEGKVNASSNNLTSKDENNNKANETILLEYAKNHFNVRTLVGFCDLTHDGLEDLIVYDDYGLNGEPSMKINTKIYVYSVIDNHVVELDIIDSFEMEHNNSSIFIYEENNKSYFAEEFGDAHMLDELSFGGKVTFCVYSYEDNGHKVIKFEDTYSNDLSYSKRSDEEKRKTKEFENTIRNYFKNSIAIVMTDETRVNLNMTEDISPYGDFGKPLKDFCLEYGIISQEDIPEENSSEKDSNNNRGDKIDFSGSPSGIITASENNYIYFQERNDRTEEILQFNSNNNVIDTLYYSAPYSKSVINNMEYLIMYKGFLYGSSGHGKISKLMPDGTFISVINNNTYGSFCIIDNTIYYLEDMFSDTINLCSYNLENQEKLNLKSYNADEIKSLDGVSGVTKSYIIVGLGYNTYQFIDREDPENTNSVIIENLQVSCFEEDYVYGSIMDSLVKIDLNNLGEETIIDNSELVQKMGEIISLEQFDIVKIEGLAYADGYAILQLNIAYFEEIWNISHTESTINDHSIAKKIYKVDLNTREYSEIMGYDIARIITDEDKILIRDFRNKIFFCYDNLKGLQMIE